MTMSPGRSGPRPTRRTGLTYLETMVSAALLGLVVVAACRVLAGTARGLFVTETILQGSQLADELLAEILAQPYEDPEEPGGFGLETGESNASRATFDDVDDYDGWSSKPPRRKDGKFLNAYPQFRRSVVVEQVSDADLQTVVAAGSSSFKRITVQVYLGSRLVAERQAVVSQNAAD